MVELDYIFKIAFENKAFPNINISGEKNEAKYMHQWISNYCNAMNNMPSKRNAIAKSTCSDPMIRLLVQTYQGSDDASSLLEEKHHNLYMSAENIQGNLLEEYIAKEINKYGFLWCKGNVLKAIDFCNTNGTLLLQIKNKNNTENSSSSHIREGTQIKKWYRLTTMKVNGKSSPKFRWDDLNSIVNKNKTEGFNYPDCEMSESNYQKFIIQVVKNNPNIISDL